MKTLQEDFELAAPFKKDSSGAYVFLIDEGVKMRIHALPKGFNFTCDVVDCPGGKEEDFFTQALLGNLFGKGTRGSILGLDEAGTMLTLSREVEEEVDYKEFKNLVEDFINTVDMWRSEASAFK